MGKLEELRQSRAEEPRFKSSLPSPSSTLKLHSMKFMLFSIQFSSVQSHSRVQLFATPWIAARQASLSITTTGVYPNPCPLNWWCHPAISSSVVPFSSCLQSFPASGSFQMSQLFTWGGQSIGVSASTSVLQMNTQDWSPLGWTGWISLQSKGLSRVFSIQLYLNSLVFQGVGNSFSELRQYHSSNGQKREVGGSLAGAALYGQKLRHFPIRKGTESSRHGAYS